MKPDDCRYCGHKAKVHALRRGGYKRTGDNYQVTCNGCRCRGPLVKDSEAKAVEAWNAMQRGETCFG